MRLAKELLSAFVLLTLAYLILIHYTGFSRDVSALGTATTAMWKTAQGR